jgi:transposase
MATSSETYVGIDVSKDRLDVAMLGEERGWQVDNTQAGIAKLVQQMQEVCPELIVVEASGQWWRDCFMRGSVWRW